MVMYRSAWRSSCLLLGGAGVWAAVSTWSLTGALTGCLLVAAVAVCIRPLLPKEGQRAGWWPALRVGFVSGAVAVGAGGLVAWFGVAGLFAVTLLTLASPPVLAAAAKWRHRRPDGTPFLAAQEPGRRSDRPGKAPASLMGRDPGPSGVTGSFPLGAAWLERPTTSMDDATLCFAWRVSFVALQQPMSLFSRLQIVGRRQELLDELERRNPGGFRAWLASGARAAADPSKYITAAQHGMQRNNGW
jgi:hypothetical protein